MSGDNSISYIKIKELLLRVRLLPNAQRAIFRLIQPLRRDEAMQNL